ncbi:MAG: hypothetical protein Q4A90_02310 [Streptococcus sp.]|nr:hypothetical protein [Streptococcus sp.]
MNLVKLKILDERERELVHKAGYETYTLFQIMFIPVMVGLYLFGQRTVSIDILNIFYIILAVYFLVRSFMLGVNFYNSFYLTKWGVLAMTFFLTFMIACQNYHFNHVLYRNNVFHPLFLMAIFFIFIIYFFFSLIVNLFLKIVGDWQQRRFDNYLSKLEEQ